MNELFIEAKIENMDTVQEFISERLHGCTPKLCNQIAIAVDEIFSNISKYAYHPESGGVTVRIIVDNYVTVEFEDTGIEYDPLTADPPDTTLPAEEREIGGLGIFMVKNLMDSVEYSREGGQNCGKNILKIKKKIKEIQTC